jgi:crossover junction endonuclease EME1
MLSQIPRITESGACEVVKRYPTFRRMMEAWEVAEGGGDAKTAEEMLRDCPVRTGNHPSKHVVR